MREKRKIDLNKLYELDNKSRKTKLLNYIDHIFILLKEMPMLLKIISNNNNNPELKIQHNTNFKLNHSYLPSI